MGAAILGAVAAGEAEGGWDSIGAAAERMGGIRAERYEPRSASQGRYAELYVAWNELHDYFGNAGNTLMRRLRSLRR